jgi:hypothetical protein
MVPEIALFMVFSAFASVFMVLRQHYRDSFVPIAGWLLATAIAVTRVHDAHAALVARGELQPGMFLIGALVMSYLIGALVGTALVRTVIRE